MTLVGIWGEYLLQIKSLNKNLEDCENEIGEVNKFSEFSMHYYGRWWKHCVIQDLRISVSSSLFLMQSSTKLYWFLKHVIKSSSVQNWWFRFICFIWKVSFFYYIFICLRSQGRRKVLVLSGWYKKRCGVVWCGVVWCSVLTSWCAVRHDNRWYWKRRF